LGTLSAGARRASGVPRALGALPAGARRASGVLRALGGLPALGALLALGAGACHRRDVAAEARPATAVPEAVRPELWASALQKLGGAHMHSTLRYAVGRGAAPPLGITTTTDLWLDRTGNYRLREENDHDGGREVVLTGRELAVALRYGKMIRRVAEEPEPRRLLEEGLGGPWAAFELCAPRAHIEKIGSAEVAGARGTAYTLSLGDGDPAKRPPALPLVGLRAWRGTAAINSLTGRAVVDDATGALTAFDLTASFEAKGENGPEQGTVEAHATLADVGSTAAIERPAAEELSLRQRTVPEARELLRGLAEPERRAGAPKERRP
jgi:hypothetical protein